MHFSTRLANKSVKDADMIRVIVSLPNTEQILQSDNATNWKTYYLNHLQDALNNV